MSIKGPGLNVLLWCLLYIAGLIVARNLMWFDDINHRLTVPAGVGLVIALSALAVRSLRADAKLVFAIATALLCIAWQREIRCLQEKQPLPRDAMPATERLVWISKNTTDADLIVGDYTMDIPFFTSRRKVVAFLHYPASDKLSYDVLITLMQRQCGRYRNAYMIIRDWNGHEYSSWRRAFGPFIADVATGRLVVSSNSTTYES